MTDTRLEKLKKGMAVRIANPVNVSARFYSLDLGYIVGAGGKPVDRQLLDGPAFVVDLAPTARTWKPKVSARGLVVFGSPDSNDGMWLDASDLCGAL